MRRWLYTLFATLCTASLAAQFLAANFGTTTAGGAVGGGAWADDCAAADLKCIPFDDDGDITSWLINGAAGGGTLHDPLRADTDSNLVTFEAGDGCMGTGAVQIEDSDGVDESPVYLSIQTWPDATSAANITGAGDIEHVVGIGETVYARFCVNFSAALLGNDTNWDGHKIVSFTGAYNSNTAQEAFFMRNTERDYTSVSNSNSVSPWFSVAINGGIDFDYQPGSEFGLCYDEMEPLDCYIYDPDTWYVVRMALTPGAKTTPTTHITVDVAKYGDLDWTRIYDRDDLQSEDYEDDGPGGAEGYSAFLLWNRHEGHDSQPTGITQKFSNLILTTDSAPALPDWDEWTPSAPSWFTSATPDRWEIVPGTDTTTIFDVVTDTLNANYFAYSGRAADAVRGYYAAGGGHADADTNPIIKIDLLTETPGWEELFDGSSSSCFAGGASCTTNGIGAYGDGSRTSDHNYTTIVATDEDVIYFGLIGSGSDNPNSPPDTFSSTAVWKWRAADLATALGYTYLGKGIPSVGGAISYVESVSCYDATNHKFWTFLQSAFQANPDDPIWVVDTTDDSFTTLDPYSGFQQEPVACQAIDSLDLLVLETDNGGIQTTSASSPGAFTARTPTCTFFGSGTAAEAHAVYSPAAGQILGRAINDGNSLRYMNIPATAGGTWSCGTSTAAAGGEDVPEPDDANNQANGSAHFQLIPDFGGSGDDIALYHPIADGPVYFQRIDGPRSAMFEIDFAVNDSFYDRSLAA